MASNWYIITWNELHTSKAKFDCKFELSKGENENDILSKMKLYNAQKRLTTFDYKVYNLNEHLDRLSLQIISKVKE